MPALVLVAAAALAGQPPAAPSAQPEPAPESGPGAEPQAAGSLEVSAQLWAVIARYRFAATADEVRVTLAHPSGRSDTHSLVVRCIPGPAGLARVELGEVIAVASRARLAAVHEHDPTTYAEAGASDPGATPADVLRELLPPLPIPQLSLAFDAGDVDWCPLVERLRWESAERIERDGERGIRLTGRSASGPASLVLAAGRVRRFDAVIDAGLGLRLIVECEPIDPGDPGAWGLDTSGRRRLDRLALLRPLGPALAVGARWPGAQATPVDSREAGEWPPLTGAERPESRFPLRAAWLFRADEPATEIEDLAVRTLGALVELRREIVRGRIDGRFDKRLALREVVGIALVEQEGGAFERIDAQHGAWRSAVAEAWPAPGEPPALLWMPAEARLLDRVAPGERSALVLLDGSGTLRAIAPVRPGGQTAEISAALAAGLAEPP